MTVGSNEVVDDSAAGDEVYDEEQDLDPNTLSNSTKK